MIRCKLKLEKVDKNDELGLRYVQLTAVTNDSPENKTWSKYTPSAQFWFNVTNPACFAQIDEMKAGDEYFVDLHPVKEAKP
jgi:hypothetical protein